MPEQLGKGEDQARGDLALNAQITLISILLGAILGALFIGIPPNFAVHVWSLQALPVDLRVFATFLVAVDTWIEYSWAVIVYRWPLSLTHSLSYFAIAGALIGVALSVDHLAAWLAWAAVVSLAVFVETVVDILIPINRSLRTAQTGRTEQEEAAGKSRVTRLIELLNQTRLQAALYLVGVPLLLYGAFDASNLLPTWAEIHVPPSLWGALGIAIVGIDMFIEGRSMVRRRYDPPLIF